MRNETASHSDSIAAAVKNVPLCTDARHRNLQRLRTETFDVLVVGGGINGAGIARDAAMRGLRTALVEKGDFASGTSSKSSKLIHGGIRYLQQGNLRLVRVACLERDLLRRRLAPHLVEPLAFIFPVYRGDPVGLLALGAGMWLYDLLAVFRNIRAHRMLTAKRTEALEPGLRTEGLRGAALYYDCWTDDARLTLETILAAHQEGAVVANYLALEGFRKEGGRIVGAVLRDRFGAPPIEVRSRCVVNATGPWADAVRRIDDITAPPCLRLTKGAHIIVPRARLSIVRAVVLHSPRDGRLLFAIPWGEHTLIGTTDTDFDGSLDDVQPEPEDFDYLLEAANWFFPKAQLRVEDIVGSYAGLRPLVASDPTKDPSSVSREEFIFESPSGLITLAGGKLTTYRLVAKEIVDRITKRLHPRPIGKVPACTTGIKPLPGGLSAGTDEIVERIQASGACGLTAQQVRHLARRYGSRATEVLALVQSDGNLKQLLVPGMPDIWAEVAYAISAEMAVYPDDILMRRTQIGVKDPLEAAQVSDLLSEKLTSAGAGSSTP